MSATEGLDRLAPEKFRFPSGERGQGQGLYAAERLLGNANTEPNQGCRRLRLPFQPYRAELTKLPREVRVARLRTTTSTIVALPSCRLPVSRAPVLVITSAEPAQPAICPSPSAPRDHGRGGLPVGRHHGGSGGRGARALFLSFSARSALPSRNRELSGRPIAPQALPALRALPTGAQSWGAASFLRSGLISESA